MHGDYRRNRHLRNAGFSALLCISFGFILLLSSLFLVRAKPAALIVSGLVGAAAMMLMNRRIANYWRGGIALEHQGPEDAVGKLLSPSFLLALLFLASTGYIGAIAAGTGWATPLFPYVMFLFLFPWSQLALCRTSPATSLSVLCAGLIAGLVTMDWPPHPLVIGVAVWMFWTSAVLAWLRLILIDRQQLRATRAVGQQATENQGTPRERCSTPPSSSRG
ncbi:hypothetical protein [Massilia varians]|uniref:hypothetical protein n=1 Tax=Massilia varians TaxID=457921 RepID=UPI0024922B41|nr:hypothetical protein [Massilia varians]